MTDSASLYCIFLLIECHKSLFHKKIIFFSRNGELVEDHKIRVDTTVKKNYDKDHTIFVGLSEILAETSTFSSKSAVRSDRRQNLRLFRKRNWPSCFLAFYGEQRNWKRTRSRVCKFQRHEFRRFGTEYDWPRV